MRVSEEFADVIDEISSEDKLPKVWITRKIAKKLKGDIDLDIEPPKFRI